MTANEGYVTTEDGVRLFYQTAGNGSKVVVIPNRTYMFDDFKYLADERTVISYDLRNRGRSDAVTDATRLKRGSRACCLRSRSRASTANHPSNT